MLHNIQQKKKLQCMPSAGEVMAGAVIFWDEKGVGVTSSPRGQQCTLSAILKHYEM
jgi:hypothetical protein